MISVTLITTGQPTTNPRLVKEVDTLMAQGYKVKVICCFYQQWAQPFDAEITARHPGVYLYCGGNPVSSKWLWYKTRLRQKLCLRLFKYTKTLRVAANAISRTHTEALHIAKSLKSDIYIAHNLGALPAAVAAAKYQGAKVGYDAEDMHSGQYTSTLDVGYLLNKYIEEQYFKHTDYFTAASPLIAANYKQLYPYLQPVVVNNVFKKTNFPVTRHPNNRVVKLLWFSQTVGAQRGIESIIEAMAGINHIQLHLLGKCTGADQAALLNMARLNNLGDDQLQFHPPVSPDALLQFASGFDIGMATETDVNLNRDICLTNKIFTYLQCGLAIIASDTRAQSLFFEQYPNAGKVYQKHSVASLSQCIKQYAADAAYLYQTRLANYQLGQTTLNWETESAVFLNVIKQTTG